MSLHSFFQRHVSALPRAIFRLITFSFVRQTMVCLTKKKVINLKMARGRAETCRWEKRTVVCLKKEKVINLKMARTFFFVRQTMVCLTYSILTPWCRVLLDQLTGLQLVKNFPAFYGNRRFITALTSVRHLSLSWASPLPYKGKSDQPEDSPWKGRNMSLREAM